LRAGVEDVWQKIMAHPFLVDLERDALSDETLRYYFVQNVHYIDAAIRFTAQAAAKAPTKESQDFCLVLSQFGSEEVERQRDYVRQLAGDGVDWEIAPTAHAYTNHLLTVAAYGGTLELLVGLLPCEWTYDEFGTKLAPVVRHPITTSWLSSFGSEEHNELSHRYHEIVEDLARDVPARQMEGLHEIFKLGARYEWKFWEMAYTQERWPV
jgi:thiaminase/transcriptional activator TenA